MEEEEKKMKNREQVKVRYLINQTHEVLDY